MLRYYACILYNHRAVILILSSRGCNGVLSLKKRLDHRMNVLRYCTCISYNHRDTILVLLNWRCNAVFSLKNRFNYRIKVLRYSFRIIMAINRGLC